MTITIFQDVTTRLICPKCRNHSFDKGDGARVTCARCKAEYAGPMHLYPHGIANPTYRGVPNP